MKHASIQKFFPGWLLKIVIPVAVVASFLACNNSTTPSPSPYALPKRYFKDSVESIFYSAGCTGCHGNGGSGWQVTGGADTGLDLTYDSAYKLLVNRVSYEHWDTTYYCGSPHDSIPLYRVKPFSPDSSYLYHKLVMNPPECGARMPAGEAALSAAEIGIIKKWIQYGAPLGDTASH